MRSAGLTLFVSAIAFLFQSVIAHAADNHAPSPFVEAIRNVKQSVVPVVCAAEGKDGQLFLLSIEGTAFFVSDDGDVVTAGHVAQGLFAPRRLPSCPIAAIYIPRNGWNSQTEADLRLRLIAIERCVWTDTDIGVCTLRENPFTSSNVAVKPHFAALETTIQADGVSVAFTGFPLSFTQPITSQGTIGIYRAIGDIGPVELVIDKNAWPGASGSPVYLSDGKIIGMITQRGFNDASGLAFARTSAYISAFLAKNKTERGQAPQRQPKGTDPHSSQAPPPEPQLF